MIDLIVDYANEQSAVEITPALLDRMKEAAASVLQNEGLSGAFEISLTIADKPAIKELNAAHRGMD